MVESQRAPGCEPACGLSFRFHRALSLVLRAESRSSSSLNGGLQPMASFNGVEVTTDGTRITVEGEKLSVPSNPIIPFIEGDGTGRDIWRASRRIFDAAVAKAYDGKRRIVWYEVFAGEKAFNMFGPWLPDETGSAIAQFSVPRKRP